ncbi:MAG: helix-turn-helix domain-containing protein [Lachnospiraceae bacterium]|nr:helix-turn-helix domain-containing protein [Lachnospiraceae bacterium]
MIYKTNKSISSYRHFNFPVSFPGVALLGNNWVLGNRLTPTLHFHNCIEIGMCLSGTGALVVEDTSEPFTSGDCSFIFANTNHTSYGKPIVSKDASAPSANADSINRRSDSSWEYLYFDPHLMFSDSLPDSFFNESISALSNASGLIKESDSPQAYQIITQIFKELHERKPDYQIALKGLLLSLLILMSRKPATRTANSNASEWFIHKALNYMHTNYTKKISVAHIAMECCNLSEAHFRRCFNEVMNIGPLDYINHLRIQRACQLIHQDKLQMKELAVLSGFPTLSSFNRTFQAFMGCSPSEWKRNESNIENAERIFYDAATFAHYRAIRK